MVRFFSKTAFTLIELIVSLVLVSIVLLGIFSITNVLSNNNQDYGQRYLVNTSTQSTLQNILNNASLAIGSGLTDVNGNPDKGILIGASGDLGSALITNNLNSFCIHQAANNNTVNNNSANDYWVCYTYYGPGTAANNLQGPSQIFSCNMAEVSNNTLQRGAANCSGNATSLFVGSANLMTPSFSTVGATPLVFSMSIQNCLNNAATSCNGNGNTPGTSSDPANNPEVTVSGSVVPPGETN